MVKPNNKETIEIKTEEVKAILTGLNLMSAFIMHKDTKEILFRIVKEAQDTTKLPGTKLFQSLEAALNFINDITLSMIDKGQIPDK